MRFTEGLALAAIVATTACTTTYAYVPATSPAASVYGFPAADYSIPPPAPRGNLRVASYGVEALSPADAPGESIPSLHLRISISNASEQAWTVDTREQLAALEGQSTSTPAFATANPDGSGPPLVTIAPNTTRVVDLFFLLPEGMQTAATIPRFQFTATVNTHAGAVSETTPFVRVETDGDSSYTYDYAGPYPGYGPWVYGYDYWAGPSYFNPAFVGFYGGYYPYRYWGHPFYAHGPLHHRGYGGYHGSHGGYHGHPGGYHGGGGHGGHR